VCIVSWPGACEGPYVPVTIDNGRANTWDGMPFEPEHISYVWGRACSPAAVEALIGAWQVAVIDPVWGRNDLVNGRGGSRGSDGTHCLAAVRALGAASGPGTTLRNAVARGETAPMGADPPLERWADDEALRALARLARNLPVVGADEAMAPPGAADWSAARRHPAGARSPGSPQCLSFRARRCAGCGSKRGRKVHFSLQHARFIDAVCSRGLGLQEAGAEVEEDPEVAENLWRMMLEIAENERRFPPPAG
jgi:hypothetical protein